jgi:predicted transcriptional regulator
MNAKRRPTEITTMELIKERELTPTRIRDVTQITGMSKASALYALKQLESDGVIIPVSESFNSKDYIHADHIDKYNKEVVVFKKEKTIGWDFIFRNMAHI